jgi:hypothetical protein
MSGIFKAVGKVFKSVFKVLKKVALPALAIGAIVLTGGAALGLLPAVGTVIGGLGLSAGVTAALTSAVTMAGWGGLAGLVTGGSKGMVKGALIGGLLGGVGGAAGLLGGAGTAATAAGAGATTVPAAAQAAGGAAAAAAPATAAASAAAAPAAAGGGGLSLGGLLGNGGLGTVLSGLGGGLTRSGDAKAEAEAFKRKQQAIAKNYDIGGSFLDNSLLSPYAQPGYVESPELDSFQGVTSWQYDPEQGKLVKKPVAGG